MTCGRSRAFSQAETAKSPLYGDSSSDEAEAVIDTVLDRGAPQAPLYSNATLAQVNHVLCTESAPGTGECKGMLPWEVDAGIELARLHRAMHFGKQ